MKKTLTTLFILFPFLLQAQVFGPVDSPYNSIRQNGVSTIASYGDTIWISPALNRNIGNQAEWYTPENADSVVYGRGRVFSLALGQDTVVAGLGFSTRTENGIVPGGYGYYTSTDGGTSWNYYPFPLDPDPSADCTEDSGEYDPDCDIEFTYGGITYLRTRTVVPEQSPPYDIAFNNDVILSANWGSGLLRSTDFGSTWERIILPPSYVDSLTPDDTYEWVSEYRRSPIERYDPRFDNNLLGFGLLVDSGNRVWFGTAGGLNISRNALFSSTDSIAWKHVQFDGSSNGLTGNWIIEVEEQPGTERIWMTNWPTDTSQTHSLVYTEDGGDTFTQMLLGERINDLTFKDGYVFAAGDNGLFISSNGGDTWIKSPPIKSPNTFIKPSAQFLAAAATTNRVWIGTEDGMASTTDYGQTWEITRVNFPLKGGNIHDPDARSTNAYAYPNPFSPSVYDVVRIKYEVKKQGNVRIRIFDFGMNLVREIEDASYPPGTYEAVWNGLDSKGRKVANAPYIYVIETAGRSINGKILVVE